MRKKRIMIIGASKSGKTTLASILEGQEILRKTSSMVYRTVTIDVPSAYLECPWMRHHIIAAAQDASCVVMLADATRTRKVYPPGFAKVFQVPVIGIITKCDMRMKEDRSNRIRSRKELVTVGLLEPFDEVDLKNARDIEKLKHKFQKYINTDQ